LGFCSQSEVEENAAHANPNEFTDTMGFALYPLGVILFVRCASLFVNDLEKSPLPRPG